MNDFVKAGSFVDSVKTLQTVSDNMATSPVWISDLATSTKILGSFSEVSSLWSNLNDVQPLIGEFAFVAASNLLPDLSISRKLFGDIATAQGAISKITMPEIGLTIAAISQAHVSLANLVWENVGKAVKINDEFRSVLHNNFLTFSDSYFGLYQTLNQSKLHFASFTSLTTELPAIEFFNATELLDAITVDEIEYNLIEKRHEVRHEVSSQVTDRLQILLANLDNNLVRLWRGAIQSLESENEDRTRHFLISLRELLTHVIHRLAPDNEIRAWSTDQDHYENGRPKRTTRLRFICRNVDSDPFTSFLEKDISSVISAWDILNRVHQLDIPFTTIQLTALKLRVECALRVLLEIWIASR